VAGQGVEGLIDGRHARLGRAEFVGAATNDDATELWFGFDGDTRFRLRFADAPRFDATETVAALHARGLTIEALSGDRSGAVGATARAVGIIDWQAGCTPEGKAATISGLTAQGHKVLMVGDGLNDTGALAVAHASMAPGAALAASQNAADLVFSGEGLSPVVDAVDIARDARARALENFAFAAAYNLLAAPAAMLGLVNPFVAAIAMSASSLVVTLNALRTGWRR
jgi:Cu2+-exporting ATPase